MAMVTTILVVVHGVASQSCAAGAGTCIDTNTQQCLGSLVSGFCPGGDNILCCEAWCDVNGVLGTCIDVAAQSCPGNLVPSSPCPGNSDTVVCCNPPPIWGPDVSNWQGPAINWTAVKSAGAFFAFTKATEGLTYLDPTFSYNWAGIVGENMLRGAYHFGHPEEDAIAQAKFFVSTVGPFRKNDYAILDIEESYGMTPAVVADWCRTFCDTVVELSGISRPQMMVYTGAWVIFFY